jgi:hypothetical protein
MCSEPLSTQQLLSYWLDETSENEVFRIEEHLFSCASCSASLEQLTILGEKVRKVLCDGNTAAVLPMGFVQQMKAAGLRIREYRLGPQGSVNCTVTSDDDLVLAHLLAPLRDVQRLDAIVADLTAGHEHRLTDVSFNPAEGQVVFLPNTEQLRPIQRATQRVELIAVDENGERTIASYLFHHQASSAD